MKNKSEKPIGKIVSCSINVNYDGKLSQEQIMALKQLSYAQFCEWKKSEEAKDIPLTEVCNNVYEDTLEISFANYDGDDLLCWYVPNPEYHLPKVIGFVFEMGGGISPNEFSKFVNSLTYEQCYALSLYDTRVSAFIDKGELVEYMNNNKTNQALGTIIQKYLRLF